jgi:hypothetical protein
MPSFYQDQSLLTYLGIHSVSLQWSGERIIIRIEDPSILGEPG